MFGALAVPPNKFPLTVASIMRGTALIGRSPSGLQWSSDGSELFFSWGKADGTQNPEVQSYKIQRDGTGLAEVGERKLVDRIPAGADRSGTFSVYSRGGQIYLFNEATGRERHLSTTVEPRNEPMFLDGGKAIAYVQGDDFYRMDLSSGETDQLTMIRPANSPEAVPELSDSQKVLAAAEGKLFKYTGGGFGGLGGFRRRRRDGGQGARAGVASITIPSGYSVADSTLSPNGKWLALRFYAEGKGGRPTIVPNYVTRSGYTEDIPSYEKVGDRFGSTKMEVVDLGTGAVTELKLPREGGPSRPRWSPDGGRLAVWASATDHKDNWLESFDTSTRKFAQIYDEHNEAWVGGPGGESLGWLPDGKRLYIESEKTGFSQLYTLGPDGSDLKALTSGEFEVSDVRLDKKGSRFTFVSSEGSPFLRHLDAVGLDGGERTKLADLSADEEAAYAIAPDGKTVATVRSYANRPPELYLGSKQITTTPTAEWLSGPWTIPPIVMLPARDGTKVPAHLYLPAHWKRGGPAVVFVHGAGYLQNVYEGWSYYYREYMFHHLLSSMGYVVLDIDYRGSAGYGANWRTAIYRHMGGKDLDDQVDGARWLVQTYGVNERRIGIYGGSYGGFITLMAMFTQPGVFAAGAALRPVSDWANYNDGYTGEILNLPQNDPMAYQQSSPINFVSGLEGSLLICHGMVDTNVHFQDSVRLTEKLIELGKRNWQLAPYPTEDHSFVHPESWTDEYRRILELFERTIGSGRPVQ
jgi:dipeptidyl aminopeptidase/acylaminoacyl peptidase